MDLFEYFNKDKHTRQENKKFNEIMRKKYKEYLKAYHEGKIEYRTRTVDKFSFSAFKNEYKNVYNMTERERTIKKTGATKNISEQTIQKNALKDLIGDKESFSTLSEDSYEIKRQNLKVNQKKYENLRALGIPLTEAQELVLSIDADGNIHKIVAYFDKLGLNHEAFDSPGSAEE